MYYKQKFHTREELVQAITEYMNYYTNDRPQRGLGILTPMEFYEKQLLVSIKMLPGIYWATQKLIFFLFAYLTGSTPNHIMGDIYLENL